MYILQLNPPLPLETPKGSGLAWLLIDYGVEFDLMWTVAINETGEIWTFNNKHVRASKNITLERFPSQKPNKTQKDDFQTIDKESNYGR